MIRGTSARRRSGLRLLLLSSALVACGGSAPAPGEGGDLSATATADLSSDGVAVDPIIEICKPPCKVGPVTLASQVAPTSIASDGATVFFTNHFSPIGPQVLRVPVAGGALTTLLSGPRFPQSIALEGGNVYWTEWSASSSNTGIWQTPVAGGALVHYFAQSDAFSEPQGLALATDADGQPHAFWANADVSQLYDAHVIHLFGTSFVWGMPLLPAIDPVAHVNYYPDSVAVDGVSAYFLSDIGNLYRVPRTGGTPTLLDSGAQTMPLATDGTSLFYAKGGSILKMAVGGGPAATFASGVGTVSGMALHGGALYWSSSSSGTIEKQPTQSGAATVLASGEAAPACIAVDGAFVYWGTPTALRRTFN